MDPPSSGMLPTSAYEESFGSHHEDAVDEEYGEVTKQTTGRASLELEGDRLDALLMDTSTPPSPITDDERLNALLMDENSNRKEDYASHSLPTPEEARLNALLNGSNPHNGRRKRLTLLIGICFAALVAITGFSIAIGKANSSSRASPADVSTSVGLDDEVPNPDEPIVSVPESLEEPPAIQVVQDFLVAHNISKRVDLENHATPQYHAAKFMAETDSMKLAIPPEGEEGQIIGYEERYILAVFYYAMNGHLWKYDFDFMSGVSICDWNVGLRSTEETETLTWKLGIECNANGRVNSIFMTANNLDGEFPPEIGLLSSLEHLSFFNNNILGHLPREMENLTKLRFMALQKNTLSGSLPSWLNKWTSLEYLALGSNGFDGQLPSFEGMANLKELSLESNSLTGGVDELNSMVDLEAVFLNDNSFDGRLHGASFRNFNNLVHLDLSNNRFTGRFHEHMYDIKIVELDNNQLSGPLPDVQVAFPIEYLSLDSNNFTGGIPGTVGFLNEMTRLDLSNNKLDGTIPDSINSMKKLKHLFVSNNPFTPGHLPYMKDLVDLKEVSFEGANREKKIPSWLGDLSNLKMIDLQNNALTGEVPSTLGNLPKLRILALNRNKLDGQIPGNLASQGELAVLFMDKNDLTGAVGNNCDASGNLPPGLESFVTDCSTEVTCNCCTRCCADGDEKCNAEKIEVNRDLSHLRTQHIFSEDLIFEIDIVGSDAAAP